MESDNSAFVKLLIIGDSGVGKSCILTRFCENRFIEAFYNTIGVDFKTKQMNVLNKKCKLQIWDTAGQQRFRTITANYYKGAHGIVVVYDITSRESFQNVNFWLDEIKKHNNQEITMILIGNKSDFESKREVSEDQANQFARNNAMGYVECSALKASNIELVFETITKNILLRRESPKKESTQQVRLEPKRKGTSNCC